MKEEKVSQIISAATNELLLKGFDAASMHHIAENAGVSKRTLYKYFSSKDELYDALIDSILDRVEEMYQVDSDPEASVQEQIDRIVASKIELTLTDSFINISKIVIGELFKSRPPSTEQMARMNRSEAQFVDWIREAQKNGRIKNELGAEEIASQFHSILKGQIFWPVLMGVVDKADLDLERVRKTTVQFFVRSFCER